LRVNKKIKIELYYYMRLGRAIEERLESLYRQGRMPSAIYLGRGQEAITVGAAMALEDGDTMAPTHRDMIAMLPRGMDPKMIFAQHYGKVTSPTKGRGEATYLGDMSKGIFTTVSMLPDFYPVSAGAALSFKLQKMPNIALAFSGEGATSRGDFHEALNFASVLQLPAVFVVENNHFAYSTPVDKEMKVDQVSTRAIAYDMEGSTIDGNDILTVYESVKKAVDRARSGKGPTLIEAVTMRMKGHSGHDPMKYVPEELLEKWRKKDPIDNYQRRLQKEGTLTKEEIVRVSEEIEKTVEDAVAFAEESPFPREEDLVLDVYR